ncbi:MULTISPECIES: hypothetical protein [unclassified Streptomyces]|uniref:hypothetical protein n=1 Tax=unclassified Streptomyces TaxID=2593676 RepID=UPI002365D86D|nr:MULTISPECIES: hypothetical protein [unclassified Streptomyces]MDF3143673.1 hypothetical protein [Streptomyces sp. T21Q-yed]WDF44758.1 hypothetical protein PBV52_27620 [Streptomyces sp. T12]
MGPERPGPAPARGTLQAAFTAVAVVVALALFASACATGGTGARDEGPAHDAAGGSAVSASLAASPSASATPDPGEAVRLVKADPAVSAEVKRELKPCVSDDYPVDVSYGDLTGGPADDIVVNVLSCSDQVGVASYVYREQRGAYRNVFKTEEPPVYAEIDRGLLVVTKQVYAKDDALSNPSSEYVIQYLWTSDRFVQKHRWRTDYGTLGGGDESAAPDS